MSNVYSRAFGGWLAACGVATAVTSGVGMIVLVIDISRNPSPLIFAGHSIIPVLVLIDFILICLFTAIPAAVVIWLSEKFRLRSVVFFGCPGAVISAVTIGLLDRTLAACARGQGGPVDQAAAVWTSGFGVLFILAGLAAGVTYWFVTGKHVVSERTS